MAKIQEIHDKNYEKIQKEKEDENKLKEYKIFKRYTGYVKFIFYNFIFFNKYIIQIQYFTLKEKNKKQREKTKQLKEKIEAKDYKLKEIEKEMEDKKIKIVRKMRKIENLKEKFEKEREKNIIKTQALNRIKSQKIIFNRERLIEENENRRDEILNDELVKFNRAIEKDFEVKNKKYNAQMNILINKIEYEDEIKNFLKQRKLIQSHSIMNKTKREKFQIYQKLLKKEKEEEEEKKKK